MGWTLTHNDHIGKRLLCNIRKAISWVTRVFTEDISEYHISFKLELNTLLCLSLLNSLDLPRWKIKCYDLNTVNHISQKVARLGWLCHLQRKEQPVCCAVPLGQEVDHIYCWDWIWQKLNISSNENQCIFLTYNRNSRNPPITYRYTYLTISAVHDSVFVYSIFDSSGLNVPMPNSLQFKSVNRECAAKKHQT